MKKYLITWEDKKTGEKNTVVLPCDLEKLVMHFSKTHSVIFCMELKNDWITTREGAKNGFMEKVEDIITDDELLKAWGLANFGAIEKREVLRNSLLQYVCGYSTGHTAFCICKELGLIKKDETLTDRGKEYLFAAYSGGESF